MLRFHRSVLCALIGAAFLTLPVACTSEPAASSSSSSSSGSAPASSSTAGSSMGGSGAVSTSGTPSGGSSHTAASASGTTASSGEQVASSSLGGGSSTSRPAECEYLDLDIFIVQCGAEPDVEFGYLRRWTDLNNNANCADYWTLLGGEYASDATALSTHACSTQCRWAAGTSVSYLHCGFRSGYIIYRSENCADVYEYPEGIYRSPEDHERAHPCP